MRIYIYTLSCPVAGTIRYAGQSKNPKRRMYQYRGTGHAKLTDWIAELKSVGKLPVMNVVDECEQEYADALEGQWITSLYYLGGHKKLLNTRNPGYGGISRGILVKKLFDMDTLSAPIRCQICYGKILHPGRIVCFPEMPRNQWFCEKCVRSIDSMKMYNTGEYRIGEE